MPTDRSLLTVDPPLISHSATPPIAFVILKGGVEPTKSIGEELRQHVGRKIGAVARPRHVLLTPDLPETRSGKIMRRPPARETRTRPEDTTRVVALRG